MDWSPTDLLASLNILISLAILRTCMIRPTSVNMFSSASSPSCSTSSLTEAISGSRRGGGAKKRSR